MIIQAAGRFTCGHRYVVTATDDGDKWLFICEGCGHRTAALPLKQERSFGQVLAFPPPSVGPEFSAAWVSA